MAEQVAEHVKHIAEMLSGGYRDQWREENGWREVDVWDEDASDYFDEWVNDEGWTPDEAGVEEDHDGGPMPDGGWASWWAEDMLDVEFRVGTDGELRGTRVLVAFGGPNIWVDFGRDIVEGAWWGDSHTTSFTDAFNIGDYLNEWFQCR